VWSHYWTCMTPLSCETRTLGAAPPHDGFAQPRAGEAALAQPVRPVVRGVSRLLAAKEALKPHKSAMVLRNNTVATYEAMESGGTAWIRPRLAILAKICAIRIGSGFSGSILSVSWTYFAPR